ncbi:phosphatase PAP2 family protein [Pseudonocardiaceae bacterium YIM PH 21723]|nr:phosphatase PAP2 family protein [Pseudonocardiaceae bacterium YIM PH 21723]
MTIRRPLFLAAAAGFCTLLWLTFDQLVRTEAGQRFEDSALMGVHGRGQGFELTGAAAALTGLQQASAMMLLVVMLAAVAVIGVARQVIWRTGAALGVLGGSSALAQVLKVQVLNRPDLNVGHGSMHNSFPSGHVTLAAGATVALLLVMPARLRPYVAALGAGWTALVGTATVASGWHRLSDVLGGVLLVATVTMVALAVLDGRDGSPRPRFSMLNLMGAGAVWLLVLVVAGGAVVRDATTGAVEASGITGAAGFAGPRSGDWEAGNWANATASVSLSAVCAVVVMGLIGLLIGFAGHRSVEEQVERIEWQAELPAMRFGYPPSTRPGGYAGPSGYQHREFRVPVGASAPGNRFPDRGWR